MITQHQTTRLFSIFPSIRTETPINSLLFIEYTCDKTSALTRHREEIPMTSLDSWAGDSLPTEGVSYHQQLFGIVGWKHSLIM
jgi:hypothetical protein